MMNLNALKIDPEFQGKIPPLNAEEEHILEQNMIQERRLLNPLIIWNGYILDGHSRYRILKHHPEIAFEVKEIQLPDRYAALAWICQNQLGRRNLDPERRKFLMGKAYVWGDRIFEKCGIRRDEGGDGGKTLEIRGKRRLSARDGGANYQQS